MFSGLLTVAPSTLIPRDAISLLVGGISMILGTNI